MKTFLSSTYMDLVDHRATASEAIERSGQQVGRMEVFGARPEEPSIACFDEIDKCNLFVGIYAHRYGYIPENSEISITEAEFDYAIKHNKPTFCFFIEDNHPWLPKMIDDGDARIKLSKFKKRIGQGIVRDVFTTPEDLAYKVASALGRYLTSSANSKTEETHNPYTAELQLSGDLVELLEKTLLKLENITKTDYNQIFLLTTGAYEKKLVAVADSIPIRKQRYRIATFSGLLGNVAASGKTLNAGRIRERPGYFQAVIETRSELVVSVGNGSAVWGVINSESENEDHYSKKIVEKVEMLADSLSKLLSSYGWTPSISSKEAPWIKRAPRYKNG